MIKLVMVEWVVTIADEEGLGHLSEILFVVSQSIVGHLFATHVGDAVKLTAVAKFLIRLKYLGVIEAQNLIMIGMR